MSHESQGELTSYLEEQSSEWDTKRLERALQEEINKNKVHLCIHLLKYHNKILTLCHNLELKI